VKIVRMIGELVTRTQAVTVNAEVGKPTKGTTALTQKDIKQTRGTKAEGGVHSH
jgi:hypothetical protein